MRPLLVLALLVALAPSAAAAASSVKVLGGFFDPATLAIAPGTEVTWTNDDSMPHTVTSTWDQGATFDVVLRAGESFSYTFAQEGSFGVHCRPHSGMEMTVAVSELDTKAKAPVPLPALALLMGAFAATALLRRARR